MVLKQMPNKSMTDLSNINTTSDNSTMYPFFFKNSRFQFSRLYPDEDTNLAFLNHAEIEIMCVEKS